MPTASHAYLDPLLREYFEKQGRLTSAKMAEIAKMGRLPGCAPVGYLNAADERGLRIIIVDPKTAPLIRVAFELTADGKYSLREITELLTQKGLRSRTGNVIKVSGLWSILQNPFYCGKIRFHFTVLPGSHEPIVSDELFERVRYQLERKQNNKKVETA